MLKIFVNAKPVNGPWGGGNLFLKEFLRHINLSNNFRLVCGLDENPDIVFIMNIESKDYGTSVDDILEYLKKNPNVFVVHRINDCDARKNTVGVDAKICEFSHWSDLCIFVSEWMKEYFTKNPQWNSDVNFSIYNGVDFSIFKPAARLKNGKVNIVTHHWSDNIMKGYETYRFIDDWIYDNPDFTFTYIGRPNGIFKNTCLVPPLYGSSLGKELSKYDLYISGSYFDPGPNHVIESIACGIPTYVHVDGGGSVEFAGKDHTFKSVDDLKNILTGGDYRNNKFDWIFSWKTCVEKYLNLIENCF